MPITLKEILKEERLTDDVIGDQIDLCCKSENPREQMGRYVRSLLSSSITKLLEEIKTKYGREYNDGCGCCSTRDLSDLLDEYLKK